MIVEIKDILYLDDRPVKEADKRKAVAFFEGGIEAERKVNLDVQNQRIFAYRQNTP